MIKRSLYTAIATIISGQALAGTVTTDGTDLIINTKGGIEVKTADNNYSAKLGGRIQYDYNYAELNGDADEDTFDVRRARLYVSGKAYDWSYKIQYNVGDNNGGEPEDLYIRYNGWGKKATVTIGKQKEPFGLEELTSSKDISFLERSAITENYAPGRNKGVQFHGKSGAFTYALGVFDEGNNNGDDDFAVTGRTTFTPVKSDDGVVHLGLAYSKRADDTDVTGLEVAASQGPFHVQAEYVDAEIGNTDLDGYYVQAGWIITGEQRPYSSGKFKRVKPSGDLGAVELIVRYEAGEGNYSDVELGRTDATSYGIGLNWYINSIVRAGISYSEGKDELSDDDGSEIRARLQLAF